MKLPDRKKDLSVQKEKLEKELVRITNELNSLLSKKEVETSDLSFNLSKYIDLKISEREYYPPIDAEYRQENIFSTPVNGKCVDVVRKKDVYFTPEQEKLIFDVVMANNEYWDCEGIYFLDYKGK